MVTKRSRKKRERVSARRRIEEHKSGGNVNYIRLPEGYKFFEPKVERYRLDFLPFRVGKGNPYADQGGEHYERTFYIHKDIGPNNDWHLCLAKTLGKPCPVCEKRAMLARSSDTDDDVLKALSPKQRQLFLVVDHDNPDEKLLWNYSYHSFGDKLDAKIRGAEEEDDYDYFADPEEGKLVRIVFTQAKGGKWLDCTDIEFKERKQQYKASIIDEMPCLDDLLVPTPYHKLEAEFLQIETTDDEDDDEDDEPKPEKPEKKDRKPKEETTADELGLKVGDMVVYEGEDHEIIKISKDGTSLTLEDEDEELVRAVDPADVVIIEADQDEEEPEAVEPKEKSEPSKKKSTKAKKATKSKVDDEDEDWDEDWDDDEDED